MRRFRSRRALPAKHLERYRQIVEVLADEGLGVIIHIAGLEQLAPRKRRDRCEEETCTTEQHVRRAIERLGVTFIKVGQALSTRTDIIPPALASELRKLQDEVTPVPFDVARGVIESEFQQPLEALFPVFEEEPFASASIGQVHRAELPSGERVAVKVQRPGVREEVEVDLDIILTQAEWAAERMNELFDIDVMAIVTEFAEALRKELDYVKEARNAERFWRAFKDDPTVMFPRVHWSHTSPRVLTLDLVDGVPMNRVEALEEAGFDRHVLAARGITAYLKQIFELGFFHADPHPGNFLAVEGDRVGFTDFGRVGTMTRESRERFADLMWAAVSYDYQLATDTFLALATAPNIDEAALEREVGRLIAKYHDRELAEMDPTELFGEVLGLFRDFHLGVSSDFALAIATLGILQGVGTALDPDFNFAETAEPFFDRLVSERHQPQELLDRIVRVSRRSGRLIESLPSTTDRILRRMSKGEVRVAVVPRDFQGPLDQLDEMVNRLGFAIVVAALIVGASTLLSASGVPGWLRTVGQGGLILAFGVTVWFLLAIIRAHYRYRRRE